MKRRALLSGLFALGATVAFSDPAHAIKRYRRLRGLRSGTRRLSRRSGLGSTRRFQNVSYSGSTSRRTVRSRVMGEIPANQVARAQPKPQRPQRSKQVGVDRNLPEFWKSPGEIDRPIVAKIQQRDIQGVSRTELTRKYGMPLRDEGSSMTWNVGRTSDGIIAPETVTIKLDTYGKATSFRRGF